MSSHCKIRGGRSPLLNLIGLVALLFVMPLGCVQSDQELEEALRFSGKEIELQPRTILPKAFIHREWVDARLSTVTIPAEMLNLSAVARPRAEVRLGPGIQFPLADRVLEKGTEVVLYDRVGVWQKVFNFASGFRGWVHYQTLAKFTVNKEPMKIAVDQLPIVTAVTNVNLAFAYGEDKKLDVNIPKGAIFYALTIRGRRVLVWLIETNSVVWLLHSQVH